ncbi:MAG: DHHA1 domain-containing protein [Candidatus Paceibacterota bacterium]|jgi:oligoribonuclease NrnB/cAMP/cGMP phosphodiesterase (DHH superfamily)
MIVFYHKNCPDGFASAWVAWKKFKAKGQYFPLNYQSPFKHFIQKEKIYFFDVIPERKTLEDLIEKGNEITIIDHHLSAKRILDFDKPKNMKVKLNMKHSASVLVWRYFFSKKKVPELLLYIENMDLWKFKKPYTREILATINTPDFEFKKWSKLVKEIENKKTRKKYIEAGKKVVEYQDEIIAGLVQEAKEVEFSKCKTLVVNSSILISEIGDALIKKRPPMAVIWFETGEEKRISLRSNGKIDVSKIAEKYGGGGHKKAAGFSLKANRPFPWKEYF